MQAAAPAQAIHSTQAPPQQQRTPRCLLDSPQSQALLARPNIHLTEHQIAIFRDIETHWHVELFNPDTANCLVNGRFDQTAADGYFVVLEAIHPLGRSASMQAIVRTLAGLFPEGVAFVLYAATVCLLFSDAVAHEAYRQLMQSKIDKRRSRPRAAIRAYRTLLALADDAVGRAAQQPAGN